MKEREISIDSKKILSRLREIMGMKLLILEKIDRFGFLSLVLILRLLMILGEEVEALIVLQDEVMGCDLVEVEICFINLSIILS